MVITLPAGVNTGSTVLLLPPRSEDPFGEACLRLLAGDEPRRRNVIALTFGRSAEVVIDRWIDHVGIKPANMSIVDVGTDARSATATSESPLVSGNVVRSVEDPRDLASIRAHVEELLTEPIASDGTRLVYIDSISAPLREAGPQATFSFLDDVGDLVRQAECIGFVRVDRSVHSDHSIDVMSNLVDTVLGFDEEWGGDTWAIRTTRRAVGGVNEASSTLSIDDLFELLSDRRRRLALHFLCEAEEPMATADLAMRIAEIELPDDDPPEGEAFMRIYTGLVHVHLPKLEDRGVVAVDADGETIRLGRPVEHLQPLLTLAITEDLHG